MLTGDRHLQRDRHGRRWRLLLPLVAVLAVLPAWAAAPAASASADVLSTMPADGATVSSPPGVIRLTMDSAPTAAGSSVSVVGSNGQQVKTGKLVAEESVVSVPLPALPSVGTYKVNYRIVAGDGTASGSFSFTATDKAVGAAPTPTAPVASPGDSFASSPSGSGTTSGPGAGSSSGATAVGSGATSGSATGVASGQATSGSGGSSTGLVVGLVVIAAVVAAGVAWLSRRRSSPRS